MHFKYISGFDIRLWPVNERVKYISGFDIHLWPVNERVKYISGFDIRLWPVNERVKYISGFDIRLWPVNERGNEGFVEAFYNNKWGFIGNPAKNFDDATSSFLCRKLGLR
jgi:hypothetical protein